MMNTTVLNGVPFYKKHYASRILLVALLSIAVITGVFWRLKLTGITMAGEAFCGQDEHAHTEACLAEGCTRAEHTHEPLCYSNPKADVETQADWESSVADAPDTVLYTPDLIAVAKTQLGYTESVQNFVLGYDGARCGYTRYGEWYGNPYGEWSSMFVSFCLHYAGIPSEYAPYNSGVESMRLEWDNAGLLFEGGFYSPSAGDLVFIDTDADGNAESAGILTDRNADGLTVIQGDVQGAVAACTYLPTDARILGYGSMNEVIRASATEEELEHLDYTIRILDELPTYEEVDETLLSLEDDMDAYEEYFNEVRVRVLTAYCAWEARDQLRSLVPNYYKAQDLEWIRQANTYVTAGEEVNVYLVNRDNAAATTILYHNSSNELKNQGLISDQFSGFRYWTAYVIEEDASGLYVARIVSSISNKGNLKASTANGFVMFTHDSTEPNLNISVGDRVSVSPSDFYKTERAYSATPAGTVTFGRTAELKPAIDNTDKLNLVNTVDTRGLIEINMFNYGKNINENYDNVSNYYPGFQIGKPSDLSTWTTLRAACFDLGGFVAADVTRRTVSVNKPGTVNNTSSGNAPLQGMMYPTLVYDSDTGKYFPAVKTDTGYLDVSYLFTDNKYADRQNTQNLTHLLQYDPDTCTYFYDSRKNHAQLNAAENRFEVYEQMITPCYSVYPFGNFLPLNDIKTQTTLSTEIDRDWYLTVAQSALYKYDHGYTDADTQEYKNLADAIYTMVSLMDAKYPNGWDYNDTVAEYFGFSAPDLPEDDSNAPFSKLYALDYDEATEFFFGMDMHMDFMMPKNGLTGKDGTDPMIYDFAGDDDVWVYIDGVLFLDLSGIHRHVGGKIDFEQGKVYYYALDITTGDTSTAPYRTVTFRELLEEAGCTDAQIAATLNEKGTFFNYTEHSLDFYYMERGAGSGVCRMYFNMPLLQQNRLEVIKELDEADAEALGNPQFLFQLLTADAEGNEVPFIGEGAEYTAMDVYGNPVTRKTGENGVFVLNANERAVFNIPENAGEYFVRELFDPTVFKQYGKVTIDGAVTTSDHYTDVKLGSAYFKGVDSPVKDASEGNTVFTFVNTVDPYEYGALEIVKTANEYSDTATPGTFAFSLQFGGVPVAVGTPYTLVGADGTEYPMQIAESGKLTLLAGQRARFAKLLAGTNVTLKELDADGYIITYAAQYLPGTAVTLTEHTDGSVSAPIGTGMTTELSVLNDRAGTKLNVTGTKELLYGDGSERTYTFVLEQIASATDLTPVTAGTHLEQNVTLSASATFSFTLNYPSGTAAGTYYYRIYEKNAAAIEGGDTSVFVLEVPVTVSDGAVTVGTYRVCENGKAVNLLFTNRNVRSLSVSKTVERVSDTGLSFSFTLSASVNGELLNGTYHCTLATANGTAQTTLAFADGKANFTLAHGETLTVLDLPYGTAWTVTEQAAAGFYTEHAVGSAARVIGSIASGTLEENASVAYYNIGGAELPATGSYAREFFPIVGAALMLTSTAGAVVYRKKRKEER